MRQRPEPSRIGRYHGPISVPRCQGLLSSKQLDPALRGALHSLKAVKVKAASDDTKPGTQSLVAAVSLVKWLGFMQ